MTAIRTKDTDKVGRRDWVATVTSHGRYDDPGEDLQHRELARRVWRTRGSAVKWLSERMTIEASSTSWDVTGGIRTGTWEPLTHFDILFGMVHDATFSEDDFPCAYADLGPDGPNIEWEESP